ncbi:hypothetical protein [Cobetia amphilecti]|uniref:hypothetical protein n=1 Tax=Cobetia amphilecti TaxID=1055104 RepID=UPI0026E442E5|nr:hypothetical protein [Cobetia amphilecti]MDO6815119.1 hypothetical protein [Cobetia amphilecti]
MTNNKIDICSGTLVDIALARLVAAFVFFCLMPVQVLAYGQYYLRKPTNDTRCCQMNHLIP